MTTKNIITSTLILAVLAIGAFLLFSTKAPLAVDTSSVPVVDTTGTEPVSIPAVNPVAEVTTVPGPGLPDTGFNN